MQIQKALIVDDSKSARFSIKKMLEKMSVGVDFAESAEEAIQYLGNIKTGGKPDVIFMDHLMPGMDGFEATQKIKDNQDWASIPVVMCTSKEGSEYLKEAQSHGAVDILPKPASLKQITRILDQLGGPQNSNGSQTNPSINKNRNTPRAVNPALSAGMSREAVEKIAKDTANGVARHTLDKIVEDRLKQFRRELILDCENIAKEAASNAIRQITEEIQQQVLSNCKLQLNDIAGDTAQGVAENVFEIRSAELSNTILKQANAEIKDLLADLDKPQSIDPKLLEEVRKMARNTAEDKAIEEATRTAIHVSTETAVREAKSITEKSLEGISENVKTPLEQTIKSNQFISVSLSLVALTTALAAYFL